jgi:sugar O-acyltransferase (sialic acid O-acetyltransferase NeuD family)
MNSKKEYIIIIGGGDFSKKIVKLLFKINIYQIVGYTDNRDNDDLCGVKYLGGDKELPILFQKYKDCNAVLGIGANFKYIDKRNNKFDEVKKIGYKTPALISPFTTIDDSSQIGEGTVIFDGSYIDFGVNIGNNSIVNINTTICHDCYIGNNVILSPRTIVAGGCFIEDNCFLGTNSTLNPHLSIKSGCIIGSGAIVTKNLTQSGIYIGNPAKKKNSE